MHRRRFTRLSAFATAAMACGSLAAPSRASRNEKATMRTRKIPRTNEPVPVIGLGTWQTFDVGTASSEREPLAEVLQRFFAAGGRVIDCSPMYGRAESVVGELVAAAAHPAFLATKVWTQGREAGRAQMEASMHRLRAERLDLMQVHNLLDWETHLPTMRAWRDEGKLRYLGITHYALGSLRELAQILHPRAPGRHLRDPGYLQATSPRPEHAGRVRAGARRRAAQTLTGGARVSADLFRTHPSENGRGDGVVPGEQARCGARGSPHRRSLSIPNEFPSGARREYTRRPNPLARCSGSRPRASVPPATPNTRNPVGAVARGRWDPLVRIPPAARGNTRAPSRVPSRREPPRSKPAADPPISSH
jgi:Aldo/keto reductase family